MVALLKENFPPLASFSDGGGGGGGTISYAVLWPLKEGLNDEENIQEAADYTCKQRDKLIKNAAQGKLPHNCGVNIRLHYDYVRDDGIPIRPQDTQDDIIKKIEARVFGVEPIPLFQQT